MVLLRAHAYPQALHLFARVEEFGANDATRAAAGRLRCVAEVLAGDAAAARACVAALPAGRGVRPRRRALLDALDVDLPPPRHRRRRPVGHAARAGAGDGGAARGRGCWRCW